jgi:hypothetical protein
MPAQFMAQVKSGICRWDNNADGGEGVAALKIPYKGEKTVSSTGLQWLCDKRHLFPHSLIQLLEAKSGLLCQYMDTKGY